MSVSPVLLVLGAGANVGRPVARAFAARDAVHLVADLSDPASVISVFSKVEKQLGLPGVVVYNAAAVTPNKPEDPLSLPLADFVRDLNVNTMSAFVAAQQAALSFSRLPSSASRTFIYTGNILNTTTMASFLDLGVGKVATAHIIEVAAASYADREFRFYYADQRNLDGSAVFQDVDGAAHGEFYAELAEEKGQRHWLQTFVKGVGYTKF